MQTYGAKRESKARNLSFSLDVTELEEEVQAIVEDQMGTSDLLKSSLRISVLGGSNHSLGKGVVSEVKEPMLSEKDKSSLSVKRDRLGVSNADRRALFLLEHPEFENFTPELLGVYKTCRSSRSPELRGTHAHLDEAYEHIFVRGCEWCKRYYQDLVELKISFR